MKFIDLFSGIGGFRIAFESLKYKCVFSSDIDKYACDTYNLNFGEYPLVDIKNISTEKMPDFDILCAGFPCQPFSIGGLRLGFQDTRGTLFFDIERIIREKQPEAFVLENVKGLVNHEKGKTLDVILNKLSASINGVLNKCKYQDCLDYHVFYKVLNSRDFGLPQNRERIFIVGFKNKVPFTFPNPKYKRKKISNILEDNIKNFSLSITLKQHLHTHLNNYQNKDKVMLEPYSLAYEVRRSRATFRYDGISPTLTAKMGTGGNNVPILVHLERKLTVRECLRIQGFPDSYNMKDNYSQSYKQIGNSVSIPVVSEIAKSINKCLNS